MMLEQELPNISDPDLAGDDESRPHKAKKPKAHAPLPFNKTESRDGDLKPIDEIIPLEPHEHSINLHTGESSTRELSFEEAFEPLKELISAEAAPAAMAVVGQEQTSFSTPELPKGHSMQQSEWLNIELDKAGHAVENPINAYGNEFHRERRQENPLEKNQITSTDTTDTKNEENDESEVAVASGQLAVSTLSDDQPSNSSPSELPNSGASNDPMTVLAQWLTDVLEKFQQRFESFNTFDIVLWAILFLIILAIIFAIRA